MYEWERTMIVVPLPPPLLARGNEWDAAQTKGLSDGTLPSDGVRIEDAAGVGIMGEAAVAAKLIELGKRVKFHPTLPGFGEPFDLTVWIAGRPELVDVKTRNRPDADVLMMPVFQCELHGWDSPIVLLSVRLNMGRQEAEIIGTCAIPDLSRSPKQWEKPGVGGPSMSLIYSGHTPIPDWLDTLDDGPADIRWPDDVRVDVQSAQARGQGI